MGRAAVRIVTETTCDLVVSLDAPDGAPLGSFRPYDIEPVAHFPGLGGICTMGELPTDALRYIFNCPDCQFVIYIG
jgi:hypothetical protein